MIISKCEEYKLQFNKQLQAFKCPSTKSREKSGDTIFEKVLKK